MRPRLLDLYCGQGGAAMGYYRAGFEIVGVDSKPQPRYPFEFHQADALEFLAEYGAEFDARHASPPCQDHSALRSLHAAHGTGWLLAATRDALTEDGRPWVIENVPGAPMQAPLVLCGSMFGLGAETPTGWRQLRRHRLFDASFLIMNPATCAHSGSPVGVYGNGGRWQKQGGGYVGSTDERKAAMGIDWMSVRGLSQAIPPAYTEYIGGYLLDECERRAA